MNASDELFAFVAGLAAADVPDDVVAGSCTSLLDAIGVSLAAWAEDPVARGLVDMMVRDGGAADSVLLGAGVRVPAASAAFGNGALAHALDFEDSLDGLPIHPHAQAIAAALPLADARRSTGARLLTAVTLGCEVTARLGRACGEQLAARGWYPPPILGAIGAAAACAHLLGLDAAGVRDAVSLTVLQSAAGAQIRHSADSHVRGIRDSFPAAAAVRAALLAERGVTGFADPLEGPGGLFDTHAGGGVDPTALTAGLGSDFASREVSFKPWPSCRGTHAFIEAALALRDGLRIDDIVAVQAIGAPLVRMLAEPPARKSAPTTAIDAKFSVPYTIATALLEGELVLDSFSDAARRSPDVRALARRVHYVEDADRTGTRLTSGGLHITLTDGETVAVEVKDPLGSPRAPMSREAIRDKFVTCARAAGMARHAALTVADAVGGLPDADDVRSTLGDLLARG